MKKKLFICILTLFCAVSGVYAAPTLKYHNAGTLNSWTEESYYCAPVVDDLDGDGALEIIFSNYSVTVLNAVDGSVKWKVNSGHDRNTPFAEFGKSVGHTWSSAVVCDIDADGSKDIITAHGNGLISVLDKDGYFKPGWPQTPLNVSARSVKADDLDGDGKCEIVVGYGVGSAESVYVFNYDGTIKNGWPQMDASKQASQGWSYGMFMNGITIADLDKDGTKEIIVPTDTSFISVYKPDGSLVKANSDVYGDRTWAKIALYEDYNSEIRGDNGGWGLTVKGDEMREELYKAEFGHAMTTVCDIDGDGTNELIASAIMCNRKYPVYPPSEYMTICILNHDRTRFKNDALDADWTTLPTDLGKPLLQNKVSIASLVCQTPVVSDLDGDGTNEILFNSYNGKVHCFSLNKKEPYAWPYSLTKRTNPLFEYATAPICKDIDFDGKQEVIFASFYDEFQQLPGLVQGNLYILNYEGKLISKTPLPPAKEAANKNNGAMAAPVVEDIDADGRYEVVINTTNGAICAYDL